MALLTVAQAKELTAKARDFTAEAIEVYLDAAEKRILRHIGNPDGTGLVHLTDTYSDLLRLGRPVLGMLKANVTSITIIGQTPVTIPATEWYFIDASTLRNTSCWPYGILKVKYTGEDMTAEAKEAQGHLLAIAMIADGFGSIEDGEYVERRLQGSGGTVDMIAKAEHRILSKLLQGNDLL